MATGEMESSVLIAFLLLFHLIQPIAGVVRSLVQVQSGLATAERIVVMDAGKVRSVGTHTELFEEGGLYRALAVGQLLTSDHG